MDWEEAFRQTLGIVHPKIKILPFYLTAEESYTGLEQHKGE